MLVLMLELIARTVKGANSTKKTDIYSIYFTLDMDRSVSSVFMYVYIHCRKIIFLTKVTYGQQARQLTTDDQYILQDFF